MTAKSSPAAQSVAIGVFGGTFDPIHFGHVRVASEVREQLGLSEVRLIPACRPPLRELPGAAAKHRLEMVRLAIRGTPGLVVDDREIRRGDESFSVTTLEELRNEFGSCPLVLMIGMDQFQNFERWHRWTDILNLAHLAVVSRPGQPTPVLPAWARERFAEDSSMVHQTPGGRLVFVRVAPQDISATRIRERLAAGTSVDGLLPGTVIDYIQKHRIYPQQDRV